MYEDSNVNENQSGESTTYTASTLKNITECLNLPFTREEILHNLDRLKNNKACGQDMIINEFF